MTKSAKDEIGMEQDGVHALSDLSAEAIDAIRDLMKEVRDETLDLVRLGREQVDELGGAASVAIRKMPIRSVCIAVGVGCLIGLVVSRR